MNTIETINYYRLDVQSKLSLLKNLAEEINKMLMQCKLPPNGEG